MWLLMISVTRWKNLKQSNFPPKNPKTDFIEIVSFCKIAPKVIKYLGYICKIFCHQDHSKLLDYGHTANEVFIYYSTWPNYSLFNATNSTNSTQKYCKSLIYFGIFKTLFTTKNVKNFPSSILRWDSNSQPLDQGSRYIIRGLFHELNSSIGCRSIPNLW